MPTFLNRALLEQTSFDSAVPAGNATVVHQFGRPGRYALSLSPDGEQIVETRTVFVDHPRADTASAEADTEKRPDGRPRLEPSRPGADTTYAQAMAVDVSPGAADAADSTQAAGLVVGGYASFNAALGDAHQVRIARVSPTGEEEPEFDSARLDTADTFAFNVLRPGTYRFANTLTKNEGRLVVTYPQVGREPYRPADPAVVTSRAEGFDPPSVTIGPGQGVIFQIETPSRIVVELVEPDDGPGDRPRSPVATRRRRPSRPADASD